MQCVRGDGKILALSAGGLAIAISRGMMLSGTALQEEGLLLVFVLTGTSAI